MNTTLFYSWQSDTDGKTNKNFIKTCLEKAIKDISQGLPIVDALRIDHDTKGEPGIPDIANTIYKKIEESQIFVADVTCVGAIEGKGIPNPNVLIELGYALKAIGDSKIILVMNVNYGDPKDVTLPFDLNHKRWPIRYDVAPNESEGDVKRKKDGLASELKSAIKFILEDPNGRPKFARAEPAQRATQTLSTNDVMIGTLQDDSMAVDILARIVLQESSIPDVNAFIKRVRLGNPYCPKCHRPLVETHASWMADGAQTGYRCKSCEMVTKCTKKDVCNEVVGEVRRNYSDFYKKYQEEIEKITGGHQERYVPQ